MTTLSELYHKILNDFCSRVQDWWDFTVSFERKTRLSWKRSSGNVENSIENPVDFFLLLKFTLLISENTFSYDNFVNFLERNSESIQFKVQDWWNFFLWKVFFLENVSLDTSNAVLETLSENCSRAWNLFSQTPKLKNRNRKFWQKRNFDYNVQSDTYNLVLTTFSNFLPRKFWKKFALTSKRNERL